MPEQIRTIHCIGIAGIGLSALAQLLAHDGYQVSGSDEVESPVMPQLVSARVLMHHGYSADHVPLNAKLVIHTLAVRKDNPELEEAEKRGLTILTYAEGLEWWCRGRRLIAVSGTHGKSTTTGMLGSIFLAADLDPSILVGSQVPSWGGNARYGASDLVIIEADEYARSFLAYHPAAAIVTNIDWDHTETYPTVAQGRDAFREFVSHVSSSGVVVLNAEDPNSKVLMTATKANIVTFGLNVGDITESTLQLRPGMHGRHNLANALAAAAMARSFGISDSVIQRAVHDFHGMWRRQEIIGHYRGVTVISDYGHHPREIAATLEALREGYPDSRIAVIFQPHRGQRLKALWNDFQKILSNVHPLCVTEAYDPPGEPTIGITAQNLIKSRTEPSVAFAPSREDLKIWIDQTIKPGDVLVLFTAGDLDAWARRMVSS